MRFAYAFRNAFCLSSGVSGFIHAMDQFGTLVAAGP
jgi:hypothetical protein